jgi:hypothetical protein
VKHIKIVVKSARVIFSGREPREQLPCSYFHA